MDGALHFLLYHFQQKRYERRCMKYGWPPAARRTEAEMAEILTQLVEVQGGARPGGGRPGGHCAWCRPRTGFF